MKNTIGELTNELVKYSNNIETKVIDGTPYTTAYLSSAAGLVKVYIYIAQVGVGRYSFCADNSNMNGARYLTTGDINHPFIRELDMIHLRYGGSTKLNSDDTVMGECLTYPQMVESIIQILVKYGLVKFNLSNLTSRMSELGFNNAKLIRVIEKSFASSNLRSGTIKDLLHIVLVNRQRFSLDTLRQKDIQFIAAKLNDIGIIADVDDSGISDLTFSRK